MVLIAGAAVSVPSFLTLLLYCGAVPSSLPRCEAAPGTLPNIIRIIMRHRLTVRIIMRIILECKRRKSGTVFETNSRKLIKLLEAHGFELVGITGSHHKFRSGSRTVTVPHPKKDLPIGTVRQIYRQAGLL